MTCRLRCMFVMALAVMPVLVYADVELETSLNTANSDNISGERVLREKTERYVTQVDRQIAALDGFLNKHYADFDYTEDDVAEYVSNPINTYVMIKRTAVEWPKVRAIVFNETLDSELEDIIQLKMSPQ